MSTTDEMMERAKELIRRHVATIDGKSYGWRDVLPAKYRDEEDPGLERQYVSQMVAAIKLAATKDTAEKSQKVIEKNLNIIFAERLAKTRQMQTEAATKRAASTDRSKSARATGAELAAKKQSMIEKAQAQLEKLQSKVAVGARQNEVAAAIAGKNLATLSKGQVAHYRGRASAVLKDNAEVSLANVAAKNKAVRSASRARAAAKKAEAGPGNNNNSASVSTARSTTRKRTDGMTMEELCALASRLQAKTTKPITLEDVRNYLKPVKSKSKRLANVSSSNEE